MAGGPEDLEGGAISGINVTPLVDVMLVLLVIFMVTAPMIQQGVTIDLPQASATPLPSDESPWIVSVTVDGQIYLNESPFLLGELTQRLVDISAEKPGTAVYLRADRDASYGTVIRVIAAIKAAGIDQVGMITVPEET